MKRTLEALVAAVALSATACVTNTSNLTANVPSAAIQVPDGKLDSNDNLIDQEVFKTLPKTSYMVISESKYKTSNGEEVTLHSFGSSIIYTDIGKKTYLATANHVVENEEILFSIFKGRLEKVSEQFYLLEDYEVNVLYDTMRKLTEARAHEDVKQKLYVEDAFGNRKEPANYIIHTSDELAAVLNKLKPKKIKTVAQNETKDVAVISVPRLGHPPLPYSIGNADELQPQNFVFTIGYPGALFEAITRGQVIVDHDSRLVRPDYESAFIFDASISPGNSGGGIFAVRDGKFELVGIISAMYLGINGGYVGVKINGISDVFKGNSIRCGAKGWKCDLSMPYELKL